MTEAFTTANPMTAPSASTTVRPTTTSLPQKRVVACCPRAVIICPIRASVSTVTRREARMATTTGPNRVMSWNASWRFMTATLAESGPLPALVAASPEDHRTRSTLAPAAMSQ